MHRRRGRHWQSRLVAEFCKQSQFDVPRRSVEIQCSPYYRNSPLNPVVDALERAIGAAPDKDRLLALKHVVAGMPDPDEAVSLLARLLSISGDGLAAPLGLSPEATRKRTNDCIVDWLCLRSDGRPVAHHCQ